MPTAATANLYSTSEEASLIRLSPSSTVTIRFGSRNRFRMAAAATASGGATMAPRAIAAHQGMSGTKCFAVTAISPAVKKTAPIASIRMGRRLSRKAGQSVR